MNFNEIGLFLDEIVMRYSIEIQTTTTEWVIFDTIRCLMLPKRFKSQNEAYLEIQRLSKINQSYTPTPQKISYVR
tara:strand:- start:348 stop:572 length:225 start_codon:yes stop_codon:yes gene_type:complete